MLMLKASLERNYGTMFYQFKPKLMDNNLDNLRRLIESIKTAGFWTRLFGWKKIRNQLVDAATDLQRLVSNNEHLEKKVSEYEETNYKLNSSFLTKKEELIKRELEIDKLNATIQDLNAKVSRFTAENAASGEKIKAQEN